MADWNESQDWVETMIGVANLAVRRRLRGRPEEVEEVVQSFLVECLERRSPADFESVDNLCAYVYRTAGFRAISLLRDRARAAQRRQELGGATELLADPDSTPVDRRQERAETLALLRRQLNRLDADERELLERCYFHDLDDRQIASRYHADEPTDAARQRVGRQRRRVLDKLRHRLQEVA